MASVIVPARPRMIHPFHAVMLAGAAPMFLAALLADWAYWSSYEIQWSNFASWLLIGAMVLATIALVCAIVELVRGAREVLYVLVLAATWIVGFFDALHHGRDAWGIMPTALVLSVIVTLLAWLAVWLGFSTLRTGGVR